MSFDTQVTRPASPFFAAKGEMLNLATGKIMFAQHEIKKIGIKHSKAVIYRTVASNLSDLDIDKYDLMIFYSPAGIKSLQNNFPDYDQSGKLIAAFGKTTAKAVKEAGLKLNIPAPTQSAPSMSMALDEYLTKLAKDNRRNGRS